MIESLILIFLLARENGWLGERPKWTNGIAHENVLQSDSTKSL